MILHILISFSLIHRILAKDAINQSFHTSLRLTYNVRGGNISASSSAATGKKKKKRKSSQAVQPSSVNLPPPTQTDIAVSMISQSSNETLETKSVSTSSVSTTEQMPTLFSSPNESIYDKYAACVAATEGLRRSQQGIQNAKESEHFRFHLHLPWNPFRNQEKSTFDGLESEEEKRKYAQYLLQSSKIIRSLGLSVSQFNQISREVAKDVLLKERVMEQAYLYRLTAAINMSKVPILEDPESEKLLKSHRRRRVQMFARSMTEIEELRTEQIERLRKALNIDHLPAGFNICDPNVLPLLNPKVRAVCEAFPLQAEEIVNKYGLNSNEFNQMLEETRGNPVFRWRVKKYLGKASESQKSPIPLEITDESDGAIMQQ